MLKIRLARAGARKKVSYRVVVMEGERARNGRFVEILGSYNPRRNPPEVVLDQERVAYWIGVGAQPSETVRSLLQKASRAQATPQTA
ncbi:MAG TPA: 30S ribosomal protein S16 [Candidatus Angelobacter sp.]|nr:30S ribosomal protein S16 [Candidatus Angelobacter sp.]